ncbi:MAG: hypothetical protein IJ841_03720 [Prevotella sp.]|nr:hypothetical protein [Prevotella sp.]
MKKFLLKTLCFLLPALLVLAGAEAFVRSLPNTYKYKEAWMWQNGHRVSTLLLGNSHAYYDLQPSAMGDSIFSLANVSQRTEHDYFLLKRYAEACPRLQTVILVADNSNLFDVPMEDDEPGRATYYQLYMHYPKHSPLSRYGFELSNMTSFWAKMLKHLEGDEQDCDSLGWGRKYVAEQRNPDDFTPERMREHRFHDWPATLTNLHYVDSIAAYCRMRNLRLVLLQTPVSVGYTRKAQPWQLRYVQAFVDSCRQAYGAEVADYSCDRRFSDDQQYFDPDHLNDRGAKRFSKILGKELFGHQ